MSSFVFAGGDIEPVEAESLVETDVSPFYVGLGLSAVSTRNSRVSLGFFDDKSGEDDTTVCESRFRCTFSGYNL